MINHFLIFAGVKLVKKLAARLEPILVIVGFTNPLETTANEVVANKPISASDKDFC